MDSSRRAGLANHWLQSAAEHNQSGTWHGSDRTVGLGLGFRDTRNDRNGKRSAWRKDWEIIMTHLAKFVMVFASIAPALTGSPTLVVAQSPNVEMSENARALKSPSEGNARDLLCVFVATIETLADEVGLRTEPKTENRDVTIALSDDYFAVTGSFSTIVGSGMPTTADHYNTRVYDFSDRVLRNIDLNEKCYYESTLHAIVHFRVSELMHRKGMLAALDSGGIPKSSLGGPTTDFGLETMFGLLTPALAVATEIAPPTRWIL